jgi:multidrug efflux system membrane fusion protein
MISSCSNSSSWRPVWKLLGVTVWPLLTLCLVLQCGCSSKPAESQAAFPEISAPVTLAIAVRKTVPIELHAIGNVEAFSTVSVRAQAAGEVEKVFFSEGQDVKKGDPLFTLDARPFVASLQQLEANLARDQAQLANAKAQAERYTRLFENGIVSKDQYDSFRTNADALEALVRADKAAIQKAKVDLSYCSINSPIDGRTGSLLVHPGNIVKENDTVMVVINTINPIYVSFGVPEQDLPEIKRQMSSGPVPVTAVVPNDEANPVSGRLTFVDNTVDNTTGMIRLKGTFANAERRLWPGQFVSVTLRLGTHANAVVVPSQAVQTGQSGQYVFVVRSDLRAESRSVVSGSTVGGETVILKGIEAGEKVVTDGQLRLAPGMKVEIKQ